MLYVAVNGMPLHLEYSVDCWYYVSATVVFVYSQAVHRLVFIWLSDFVLYTVSAHSEFDLSDDVTAELLSH